MSMLTFSTVISQTGGTPVVSQVSSTSSLSSSAVPSSQITGSVQSTGSVPSASGVPSTGSVLSSSNAPSASDTSSASNTPPTSQAPSSIDGLPVSTLSGGDVVIGSQTVTPGGGAVTLSDGIVVSATSGALIIQEPSVSFLPYSFIQSHLRI